MSDTVKKSFVAEALVISVSNLLVKIIGVLFKIPMSNMLQEGMGVFNAAYSIYAMLYMVSTAGLPVAISRTVSASAKKGRTREVENIYKIGSMMFGVIGLICTLLMFFGADAIATFSKHDDAALAMKIISPTLFLVCVSSATRGYFQGLRNMLPTAISQFVEAFFKMLIGILAAYIAVKKGASPAISAACGISGLTVGTLLSAAFLLVWKKRTDMRRPPLKGGTKRLRVLAARLAVIAVPVTITSSALYFSQFLDTLVINNRLISSGISADIAERLYSSYTTLSLSISDLLPSTLVFPIAISILPAVSAAFAAGDRKGAGRYIRDSIRMSAIIGMPCAFGLAAVAREAISLVYGPGWGSPIELNGVVRTPVDIAAGTLVILAFGIIFISLLSTTNALLQACGTSYLPMISVLAGVVVLVGVEVVLVGIPAVGIYGAPIATVACYIVALALNMHFLKKRHGFSSPFVRLFLKPFICAALCGIAARTVTLALSALPDTRLSAAVSLASAGIIGVVVYVVGMCAINGITKNEIYLLPKGKTIYRLLVRVGLMKEKHHDG